MDWRNTLGPRNTIQDYYRMILETARFADVTFLVGSENTPIKAHIFILMTRSSVFETMFGDSWTDKDSTEGTEVKISDAEPEVFNAFLKFLYYNDTTDFTYPIEILYLAHKYNVPELVQVCANLLKIRLDVDSAIPIHDTSKLFDLTNLRESALAFMLKNAKDLVKQQEFLRMDEETLCELAGSTDLCIKEVDLFLAIKSWAVWQCEHKKLTPTEENLKAIIGKVIGHVRFPLMTPEEISTDVADSGLLDQPQIIALFRHLTTRSEEKRKELPPLPYNALPRAERENISPVGTGLTMSNKYNVGVYLCNEPCGINSLSYRVGPHGLVHDEDLIFSANRDIQVLGLGLYGPGKRYFVDPQAPLKSYEVEMNLYTLSPHESQRSILAEVRRCVSTREDYEVHFLHPVFIRRDRVYHIRLGFRGEETKHGVSRLSHVATNCGPETILFTFHGPFGTGTYGQPDGRIRSIVFNYPGRIN